MRRSLCLALLLLGALVPGPLSAFTLSGGGGGGAIALQEEGTPAGTLTTLNCIGTGIACTNNAGVVTLSVSGIASSGLADPGSNALIQRTALGVTAPYDGAGCTNQVIQVLSPVGAATCVTLTSAYVDSSICTTAGVCTGYQAALGFTAENVANKDNAALSTSITTYPTSGAVKSYVDMALALLPATGLEDPGADGLVLRTGLAVTAPYGGTSCTNQLLRELSAQGVANCTTVTPTFMDRSFPRMTFCQDTNETTADAYTCVQDPPLAELVLGDPFTFVAASSNVGPPTLTLDTLDPVTIKKLQGSITTDLLPNDIRAGQMVSVVYDGVFFQMVSPTGNAPEGVSSVQPGTGGQPAYYATGGSQVSSYAGLVLTPTSQTFAPAARSGAATPAWTFQGATEPTLPTAAEATDFYINLAQLKTHVGNATIPLKRHVRISSTTDGFELPGGVIVDNATFSIGGPPIAGVNASVTNAYAMWIRPSAVGATTTNAYAMRLDAPTTASTINDAALFNGGVRISTGRFDATAATRTAPNKSGATPPATCTVGDTFFDIDATAGQNLYGCTATDTWTLQAGGGGGNAAFSALTSGTNTTAAMIVGTGGSLTTSGIGQISATQLNGTPFAGTAGQLVAFGAANTPVDSAVPLTSLALLTASNTWATGTQDWSGATATLPVKAGLSAATPGTCIAAKELYVKTDAPAGQQLFVCNATGNGFVLVGDGVGSSGHILQNEGVDLAAQPRLNFLGAGVSCVNNVGTSTVDCSIPGGGGGGAVDSVFGRTGDIVATPGDYTAAQVTNAADVTSDAQVWTGSPTWASGEILTVCNTVDCTTNYERLRVSWAANVATIATESAGTGTARAIVLSGGGGGIRTTSGGIGITGGLAGTTLLNAFGNNLGLSIRGSHIASTTGVNVTLTGINTLTPTTGGMVGTRAAQTFAPTSGTATYAGLTVADTINQTGGANGSTRGLHITPTLTAAADYRAIEIAGDSAQSVLLGRHSVADTAGQTLSLVGGGATLAATNKDGGKLALKPGPSTGTGRGWVETYCLTPALASGTADNPAFLCGADGVTKPLVDASAVAVASIALEADSGNSVRLEYQVEVVNTTTHTVQVEDGYVICRAYNTNGTIAGNSCTQAFTQQLASGTLATTFTISAANPAVVSLLADSSLTPSTGWPRVRFWAKVLGHQALAIP